MDLAFADNFTLPKDWQLGKTLSESTECLWRAEKHADIRFRCKDQDKTVENDRISAHKLILACRSPVFEAMFYGELAETSDEISLPEIEKIPFLLFLRYLYGDQTDLSEEYAIDVMQIAHKYQVTTCLKYCSKFLQSILRVDNACCILENARLLEDKALTRSAIDFIDDNASAVLQSEGFTIQIGPDTLEYILRGNTLFAKEVNIIKAVDSWAAKYVEGQDMEVETTNKRNALGNALYYLRFPTMSLNDFVTAQLTYNYLTTEEERNIFRYITDENKNPCDVCTSAEPRFPRDDTYFIPTEEVRVLRDDDLNAMFGNSHEITLTCTQDIELRAILISLQLNSPEGLNLKCTIENSELKKSEEKIVYSSRDPILEMSPPVLLCSSTSPYTLKVSVTRLTGELKGCMLVKAGHKNKTSTPKTSIPVTFGFGQPMRMSRSSQTDPDERRSTPSPVIVKQESMNSIPRCFILGIKYLNSSYRAP